MPEARLRCSTRARPRSVRRFATRHVVGEAVERGRGREPDELGLAHGAWRATAATTSRKRGRAVVLDVGRDLGDAARGAATARSRGPREPLGAALADARRDRPRVLERRRRRELDVEGDERRPGGDEHRAGGRMELARAEVRAQLAGFDPLRERRRAAAAQLGPRASAARARRRGTPAARARSPSRSPSTSASAQRRRGRAGSR